MISFSFDLDWAPAWATDWICEQLAGRGLRGTFFVTHDCPSLDRLRAAGMELGVHPNYLPGSSHGETPDEVLDFVRALAPEARGVRAHALVRSTPLWTRYTELGMVYEASDLMDGLPGLRPLRAWNGLVRLPIYWEDDVHLMHGEPHTLDAMGLDAPGMKILNFHPVLLALNSATLDGYGALKGELGRTGIALSNASRELFDRFTDSGPGVRDLFVRVSDRLAENAAERGGTLLELARTA